MGLLSTIQADMIAALKARDTVKLNAIRYLYSQIKYAQIDRGELDDVEVQKLIAKEIKQGEEAIVQFKQGHRNDLVDSESQKLSIWQTYLPQMLTDAELDAIISQVLAQLDKPEFGVAMKAVMAEVGTRASGQAVASRLKSTLVYTS